MSLKTLWQPHIQPYVESRVVVVLLYGLQKSHDSIGA